MMNTKLCKSIVQILLLTFPAITVGKVAVDFNAADSSPEDIAPASPEENFLTVETVADPFTAGRSLGLSVNHSKAHARNIKKAQAKLARIKEAKQLKEIPEDIFTSFDEKYKDLVLDIIDMETPVILEGTVNKKKIVKQVKKVFKKIAKGEGNMDDGDMTGRSHHGTSSKSLTRKKEEFDDDRPPRLTKPPSSSWDDCHIDVFLDLIVLALTMVGMPQSVGAAASRAAAETMGEEAVSAIIVKWFAYVKSLKAFNGAWTTHHTAASVIYFIGAVLNTLNWKIFWNRFQRHIVDLTWWDMLNLAVNFLFIAGTDGAGLILRVEADIVISGWNLVTLLKDIIFKCDAFTDYDNF